jgi:hypothetical protein
MSQEMVGSAIDRLLSDETLRIHFVRDPMEALVELSLFGIDLTADEIDLFVHTDVRTWFWSSGVMGVRVH